MLKQLFTPALANIDAVLLIDIEKQREVALLLFPLFLLPLLLFVEQPVPDALGPGVVLMAVADEDRAHRAAKRSIPQQPIPDPASLEDFLAPAPDNQPSAPLVPELMRFGWPCVRWR